MSAESEYRVHLTYEQRAALCLLVGHRLVPWACFQRQLCTTCSHTFPAPIKAK